ncbi:hypothetical protein Mesau_05743 [Mesorhizobium australicum WSM2073]|uniref:DNA-binding domain-containing protein n=3 Tax=Mesorhizobium TaxID=68287 RepID=L0KVM2_MESAW|nr:ISBm3 transposase [Mesorhizobium ciceri biovar biserrulae WSM1271]AEH90652.1 ISBm3 transposase [Mesorhizobium opportunistum WSM2075]AGB48024.1 hypothetical protein Mesau_05743 [Mesorhizobium australicum WSM2073]
MNIHQNARLTPLRREEIARDVVEGCLSKADAARTYGVVARWVERFRVEGSAGMIDRSSRPKTSPEANRSPARPLFILRPAKDIHPPLSNLVIGCSPFRLVDRLYHRRRFLSRPAELTAIGPYILCMMRLICEQGQRSLFVGPGA